MSDDLTPCPFCGGEAEAANYAIEAAVRCMDCRCAITRQHPQHNDDGYDEAISAWNARTTRTNTATIKAAVDMMADQHGWVRTNSEWNAAIKAAADAATYIIQNIEILKPDGETYETPRVQKLARGLVDVARQDILALLKEEKK